jgi:DNA repair protein RadC
VTKQERHIESQISFLSPEDAAMVHLLRGFIAEASRIYEAKVGRPLTEALQISSPRDAYEFLRVEMENLPQEQLRTLNLNTKHRILSAPMIYQGSVNMTTVRIAEVFRPAIIDNATALILCHNHPSGEAEPSPEDLVLSQEIRKAGKLLGIDVLDHIIIGKGSFVSLKDMGWGHPELTPNRRQRVSQR